MTQMVGRKSKRNADVCGCVWAWGCSGQGKGWATDKECFLKQKRKCWLRMERKGSSFLFLALAFRKEELSPAPWLAEGGLGWRGPLQMPSMCAPATVWGLRNRMPVLPLLFLQITDQMDLWFPKWTFLHVTKWKCHNNSLLLLLRAYSMPGPLVWSLCGIYSSPRPCEEVSVVIPILQLKILRYREAKWLAQGNTAKERLTCDLNPDLPDLHLQTLLPTGKIC